MRLAHIAASLLILASLSACATKESPPAPQSTPTGIAKEELVSTVKLVRGLVLPGVGIKSLKLGAKIADVDKVLGQASEQDRNPYAKGQTYMLYHAKGIELRLQDDVVDMITLHAEHEKWSAYTGGTDTGLGPGTSAKEVLDTWGTPGKEASRSLQYLDRGLIFRFDSVREGDGSDNRVESLSIIKPRSN